MRIRKYAFMLFVVPLVIGAILYYCFCPGVIFVDTLDFWVKKLTGYIVERRYRLPVFFRYYFFDFIWAYSLSGILYIIWDERDCSISKRFFVPFALGFLMELFQVIGVAPGTADINDLAAELVGIFAANFLIKEGNR